MAVPRPLPGLVASGCREPPGSDARGEAYLDAKMERLSRANEARAQISGHYVILAKA